jgi:hypothetical protein
MILDDAEKCRPRIPPESQEATLQKIPGKQFQEGRRFWEGHGLSRAAESRD